jgi:exopolysaccharide biosynthesis polyprenyl glycosylphosphotransferase
VSVEPLTTPTESHPVAPPKTTERTGRPAPTGATTPGEHVAPVPTGATAAPRASDVSHTDRDRDRDRAPASGQRFRHSVRRAAETVVVGGFDVVAGLLVAAFTDVTQALLALAVAAVVWRSRGLYARRFSMSVLDDVPAICLGLVCGAAPAALLALMRHNLQPGSTIVLVAALAAAVVLGRFAGYGVVRALRRRGAVNYPMVMVGTGEGAVSLARRIAERPESGLRPVGFVDGEQVVDEIPAPLLGDPQELARVVDEHSVSDVVVGHGGMSSEELVSVLRTCDRLDAEIYVVPRLVEMHRLAAGQDQIWGVPLMHVRRLPHRAVAWHVKRAADILLSATALLLLSPVMAVTALAVRIELGPGVIFRQNRVGLDGEEIEVRKFRSLPSRPAGTEGPWSVAGSPEVGPVGRFIRRYSLDELPQLWNVLVGDMSLVGPRPERPGYVEQFRAEVPHYGHRHRVPVGLTGLAAVEGLRGNTSIAERAYFDNFYIENWSLWLDVKIVVRTLIAVFRGTGG